MSISGGAPAQMRCEYPGCNSHNVKDYKRLPKEEVKGWEGEPIALCPEHSHGHESVPVNPYANIPKHNDNQHN